tara:strand:- start:74 stop:1066 length:993 start_codon:yes stop_codon:yes gene_type:complete
MKILIPFSGGVNSTYAAWWFAANTPHEIVVRFLREANFTDVENNEKENHAITVATWLRANVRDFEFSAVSATVGYTKKRVPVRAGFQSLSDLGLRIACHTEIAAWCDEGDCDAVVFGRSLENTTSDTAIHTRNIWTDTGTPVMWSGWPTMGEIIPSDFDFNVVAATLTGKWEQYEQMPTALQSVLLSNHAECNDHWCLRCAYRRGYNHYVANGLTGRDFDMWCAEKGSYGKWRSAADPAKYVYRGNCCDETAVQNYLADLVGRDWPVVIETNNRIAWFADSGIDMTGIETQEKLADFCGRMGRINLDRGVNSDAMVGDEYWAVILEAAKL